MARALAPETGVQPLAGPLRELVSGPLGSSITSENWCPGQAGLPIEQLLKQGNLTWASEYNHSRTGRCDLSRTKWLFVVSIGGRTGSTTVLEMVNSHPAFNLAGENNGQLEDAKGMWDKAAEHAANPNAAWGRGSVHPHDLLCDLAAWFEDSAVGQDRPVVDLETFLTRSRHPLKGASRDLSVQYHGRGNGNGNGHGHKHKHEHEHKQEHRQEHDRRPPEQPREQQSQRRRKLDANEALTPLADASEASQDARETSQDARETSSVLGFKEIRWGADLSQLSFLNALFPCHRLVYSYREEGQQPLVQQGLTWDTVKAFSQTRESWQDKWVTLHGDGFRMGEFNNMLSWIGETGCRFETVTHFNANRTFDDDKNTHDWQWTGALDDASKCQLRFAADGPDRLATITRDDGTEQSVASEQASLEVQRFAAARFLRPAVVPNPTPTPAAAEADADVAAAAAAASISAAAKADAYEASYEAAAAAAAAAAASTPAAAEVDGDEAAAAAAVAEVEAESASPSPLPEAPLLAAAVVPAAAPTGDAPFAASIAAVPEEPVTAVPEEPVTAVPEEPLTAVPEAEEPLTAVPEAEEPLTAVPEEPVTAVPEEPVTAAPVPAPAAPVQDTAAVAAPVLPDYGSMPEYSPDVMPLQVPFPL